MSVIRAAGGIGHVHGDFVAVVSVAKEGLGDCGVDLHVHGAVLADGDFGLGDGFGRLVRVSLP
jgi:hypothetical protein